MTIQITCVQVNLYFTVDGVTPYSMAYCDHHQCYSLKALIGQLHSRLALSNETQYHDTISIDANMQPHAYGHTSFHKGDCPDACVCPSRAVATLLVLHWWVYQVNYRQTSGNLVCGLTWQDLDGANLSIATYNIWNVNSTDGQSSRVRLKRLGKVCICTIIISDYKTWIMIGHRQFFSSVKKNFFSKWGRSTCKTAHKRLIKML